MAAGTIPREGTKYGPCAEPCQHRDCAATRADAAAPCAICTKPIGYEIRFYRDSDNSGVWLTHADCAEDQAERERKEGK